MYCGREKRPPEKGKKVVIITILIKENRKKYGNY
jgi:hypothetical protein